MITATLALLLSSQDTKTQSLSDLAKSVAVITKRSALAVVPTLDKIVLVDDAKTLDDVLTPLRKEGYAGLVSDVAIVYQVGIPKSHWGVLRGLVSAKDANPAAAQGTFKPVTIPASAVKENLITFETKDNEAVKLGTLMNLELPKRIMVSPYYNFDNANDFPLAISAKDMAAGDFCRALARGLGGKLAIDQKTYTIGFDAAGFRTNMQKLIQLAIKGVNEGRSPSQVNQQFSGGSYDNYQEYQEASAPAQANSKPALIAALNLLGQSITQMNDQLLEQTFAYKGTSTRLNLATFTTLQNPAVSYLQSAGGDKSEQNGSSVQRQRRNPGADGALDVSTLVNRVNPRDPGKLTITTDFRMSLELNLQTGRRTRNAGADGANTVTVQVL